MSGYSRVPVLLPVAQDQTYDYKIAPDQLAPAGSFVLVPFGRQERIGIIWNRPVQNIGFDFKSRHKKQNKQIATDDLKAIKHVYDITPLKSEALKFAEWVANYTLSPLGMVARMMMSAPDVFKDQKPNFGVQLSHMNINMTKARRQVFDILEEDPTKIWPKKNLADKASVGTGVITSMVKQGCLTEQIIPPGGFAQPDPHFAKLEFSSQQQEAVDLLRQNGRAGQFAVTLLDGITGSGKTEVYFEAASKAFEQGQQSLILMPEIVLTNQFLDRFEKRFGIKPHQWHSNVSPSQKVRIWKGVGDGSVKAVIGARSALFLPFANLGAIIIDEEHDASYKQETQVLYHARDMAVVRGTIDQCHVVFASATPSLETLVNVENGRYSAAKLEARHKDKALPDISAINMKVDGPEPGFWLSGKLVREMEKTIHEGQQSLLFLNRRGYAPMTLCRVCAHKIECPSCSAWLVEHKKTGSLLCHHCGFKMPLPRRCPNCEAENGLTAIGPGVERIAEEVAKRLPQAKTILLSSDITSSLKAIRHIIDQIKSGQVDVIIGTQMVAKGHNFPNLALVGVVDADLGLGQADPRAAERTFQMLQQVTGRAGRAHTKGRGFVQTYMPDHPVMQAIIKSDRDEFVDREIAMREMAGYPPFGRLAAMIISSKNKHSAQSLARHVASKAPLSSRVQVLGPAEPPLAMIRGRYRFRILIKSDRTFDMGGFIRGWLMGIAPLTGDLKLTVDIDPYNFM